jgi:RNA polymerase sigma-32 factor
MAKTSTDLEVLVSKIMTCKPDENGKFSSAQDRQAYNTAFERLLRALRPRIRYFVRRYGLVNHAEDAEQAGAMAVHRAIASYNSDKAQFTTFVNWQIRGDMQALRYTLMVDQRAPAKKVQASTVSLQSLLSASDESHDGFDFDIEDETALELVERGASDYLARQAMEDLLELYEKRICRNGMKELQRRAIGTGPKRRADLPRLKVNSIDPEQVRQLEAHAAATRQAVAQRLFSMGAVDLQGEETTASADRARQLVRQAVRTMRSMIAEDDRFSLMIEDYPLEPSVQTPRQRGRVPTMKNVRASLASATVDRRALVSAPMAMAG